MSAKDLMSDKLKEYAPYAPVTAAISVPEGQELIKLNANEMPLGPSAAALEAVNNIISDCNFYTQPKLKAKIAEHYELPNEYVTVFNGAGPAIQVIGEVFLNPGDEVLLCSPTYMAYYQMPARYGAVLKEVYAEDGVTTSFKKLKEGITDKTKLIFVCNPNNPTGTIIDNDEFDQFIESLPKHVICVVDEAYFDWISIPDYKSAFRFVNEKNNVIVLRTFSKLYGLAGFRIGFSVANKELTECLGKVATYFGTNKPGAAAAMAALDDEESVSAAKKNNTEMRDYLTRELTSLGMKCAPSQAGFVYFKPDVNNKKIVELLQQKYIMIRPIGEALRVSVGKPYQCETFITAMKEALDVLRK